MTVEAPASASPGQPTPPARPSPRRGRLALVAAAWGLVLAVAGAIYFADPAAVFTPSPAVRPVTTWTDDPPTPGMPDARSLPELLASPAGGHAWPGAAATKLDADPLGLDLTAADPAAKRGLRFAQRRGEAVEHTAMWTLHAGRLPDVWTLLDTTAATHGLQRWTASEPADPAPGSADPPPRLRHWASPDGRSILTVRVRPAAHDADDDAPLQALVWWRTLNPPPPPEVPPAETSDPPPPQPPSPGASEPRP